MTTANRRLRRAATTTRGEVARLHGLRLHLQGLVQGVGLRPALARLAGSLDLSGCLTNVPGAVRLELRGSRLALKCFLERLPAALPAAARLERLDHAWLAPPLPPALLGSHGVRIVAAAARPLGMGLLAPSLVPDRAPCPACLRELNDPTDRRSAYPFISCCDCGPRYSIATAEPFSRANTTLARFPLCSACQAEFNDPDDRRFHAETIGCPSCGPQLQLLDGGGQPVTVKPGPLGGQQPGPEMRRAAADCDPLAAAVVLLQQGQILALQGVGGFQLLVNASDAAAVARLRRRKRRPDKPFALLVDSPGRLADLVQPSAAEREALSDPAAPIVLLRCPAEAHGTVLAGVAPGAPLLGVMLPASPLHLLLAAAFAAPLVATSGNRSGEPLCIELPEAMERLATLADAFLVHDRAIARALDDSVLQLIDGRPALLRRARGLAPAALRLEPPQALAHTRGGTAAALPSSPPAPARRSPESVDAGWWVGLGSDLKNAPAVAFDRQLWLAPHLGDLADGRCLERWRRGLLELLRRGPQADLAVAMDAHPQYLSHQLAGSLLGVRPQPVAHHRAHGLAVAAEHGLALPVAALVLDGLGYGGGAAPLWGCELLWLEPGSTRRLASLRPFPLPGGERAVREPRRSALGLLWAAGLLEHPGSAAVRRAFSAAEWDLLIQALATDCNSPWCSSAGRLFDAVAALLDLVQLATHDAHAGLLLQAAAEQGGASAGIYPLPLRQSGIAAAQHEPDLPLLDWQPLLQSLVEDIAAGAPAHACAARFQAGLIAGLGQAANTLTRAEPATIQRRPLILAGGCLQNRVLLEGLISSVRRQGLVPHWAQQLPINDGGLAAGQILALQHLQMRADALTDPGGS